MRARKVCALALLTAAGAAIQVIESFLPIIPAIPGGKLGAANIVTATALYLYGAPAALTVAVLRAVLGSLFGGLSTLPYSLTGAVISMAGMTTAVKLGRERVSPIGVCVIGAALHNTGQVAAAFVLLQTGALLPYWAALLLLAVVTGTATGLCTRQVVKRLQTGGHGEWKKRS